MARDYYEVLGVPRDADANAIKRAYRQQARKHHPDANPGDPQAETRFKEVNEAYEVLGDADKRARYDRFGEAGTQAGFGGGAAGQGPFGAGGDFGFNDIFETFFGGAMGGTQRQGPRRGDDLQAEVRIDLNDVLQGATRTVAVVRTEACDRCGGEGAEPGTSAATCGTCGGAGQVQAARNTAFGRFVTVQTCPQCRGSGRRVDHPCQTCHGTGRTRKRRSIEVQVPKGVDDGMRLRLRGQGAVGDRGAPSGDLYVVVHVRRHPRFQRDGTTLATGLKLGYAQLALGTQADVETLDGSEVLRVPAGTQPGHEFRLRGQGLPDVRGHGRGDLLVRVEVDVPTDLSEDEAGLLQRLAEMRGETVGNGGGKGFFGRMRDAFSG